jgi:signal transduction histidine kinase/ActR/RegA family two-component response regulator
VPEWSFQRRLITGIGVICMLVVFTSIASLFTSRVLVSRMTELATGEGQELANVRELQVAGLELVADAHGCLVTSSREGAMQERADSFRVRDLLRRMRSGASVPATGALLDRVDVAEREHQASFDRAWKERGASGRNPATADAESVLARGRRLHESLAALVADSESARLRGLVPSQVTLGRTETLLVAITIVTVLLVLVLCLFLFSGLSRSYRQQLTARTLAEHGQTEARASLSEVEALSHLKDEFLATVSHELRNPLAPILTWTQLLRSGTLDAEKTNRALEVIERNVTSQAQLIDDLVDVSRVVSGKFRLDVRPIDLVPVIRAAAEAQAPAVDAKRIRLQMVLDDRAGLVSGDSERLQQVMANLISNAIKFTPKDGRVQVVLQRVESHLEVVVSDSGIGIDAEFLPHVFEPFRQGTGGSMRRHGGLGLGLSIVHHIVELHGGTITAESAGSDQGSRFMIQFPVLATARGAGEAIRRHPIAGESLATASMARLDGVRVLVVDDEPSASEALMALFSSCGAVARVAGSATEALAVFDQWQPDVLVSDIAMPGEDGYSLIRRVRLLPVERGGAVPAVALTAYAKIEDRVTILAAGFQMYLSKPANPNELLAVVGSLAKRRRTTGNSNGA